MLCSGRVWRLAPTFFPLCNICLRHVPLDVEMYVHAGCETVDPDSGLLAERIQGQMILAPLTVPGVPASLSLCARLASPCVHQPHLCGRGSPCAFLVSPCVHQPHLCGRGGNLPFRRLCAAYGMEVSMGEMVFVRHLLKGDPQGRGRGSAAHRQRPSSECRLPPTVRKRDGRRSHSQQRRGRIRWT